MRDYLTLHLDTNKVKKPEKLSNIILRHKIKVKKHGRLSNITLRHKLK